MEYCDISHILLYFYTIVVRRFCTTTNNMFLLSAEHDFVQGGWIPYIEAGVGILGIGIAAFSITLAIKTVLSKSRTTNMNPDLVPQDDDGTFIFSFVLFAKTTDNLSYYLWL